MTDHFDDNSQISTQFNRRNMHPLSERNTNTPSADSPPSMISIELHQGEGNIIAYTHREIIIGRRARAKDPEVTVDLAPYAAHSSGVSRIHAMIAIVNDYITLQDLDSVNGTLINGESIVPLKRYPIYDGDVVTLGRFELVIRFVVD